MARRPFAAELGRRARRRSKYWVHFFCGRRCRSFCHPFYDTTFVWGSTLARIGSALGARQLQRRPFLRVGSL